MVTKTEVQPKPFYKSKTMWVNLMGVMAAVAAVFGVDLGPVQAEPAAATEVATGAGVLAGLNILLRGVTDTAVEWKSMGLLK